MENFGTATLERYCAAGVALSMLPAAVVDYRCLEESALLDLNDECSAMERSLAARRALIAGEIAHRSRPALGAQGLAQRTGHRTVEGFLKHTAGVTGQQAVTAVRAGILLGEIADEGRADELTGEIQSATQPWLRPVAGAIASGLISTAAAEVIDLGLGAPNSAVTALQLESAAATLVAEAVAGVDPDRLRKRARELRDELDLAGVKVREGERRLLRHLIHFERPGGGGRAIWDMDPETYAHFKELFDRSTSPKISGVRFVDSTHIKSKQAGSGFVDSKQAAIAKRIAEDERTVGQLASDTFLQLLVQGAAADTSLMLGSGAPVIRITVAEAALEVGAGIGVGRIGVGRLEGQADPVSIDTVRRMLCSGTSMRIGFDPAGNVLDLEREQRTFSKRQREVLSVKFGGCMDPNCERPPSWCEAHHLEHWVRDRGKTVIGNGILLCKHHHLKYHNEGYEITHTVEGEYWLIPPTTRDPEQTPIRMPLKSAALRDLWQDSATG
jgi:stage V sporulation protein SpoVS